MTAVAALLLGTSADLALGDPARRHPVAGFGTIVLMAEDRWYRPTKWRGTLLTVAGVGGTTIAVALVDHAVRERPVLRAALGSAVVWSTLGGRSLWRVAGELADLLEKGDVDGARRLLPSLAGRDPSALSASELARAGTESVAENTSDAIIGAVLYGAIGGPAAAAGFRAANTLDAMVGHHSAKYEEYGWASARLDDVLGFLPSRLGAALAVLWAPAVGGNPAVAAATLRRDGRSHPSPNAGPMEASFAGALGVQLGGPLHYGPRLEIRPTLGDGRDPDAQALRDAVRLSQAVTAGTVVVSIALRVGLTRRGGLLRHAASGATAVAQAVTRRSPARGAATAAAASALTDAAMAAPVAQD